MRYLLLLCVIPFMVKIVHGTNANSCLLVKRSPNQVEELNCFTTDGTLSATDEACPKLVQCSDGFSSMSIPDSADCDKILGFCCGDYTAVAAFKDACQGHGGKLTSKMRTPSK